MKTVFNPGRAFTFGHNGASYRCITGINTFEDDVAAHVQKKRASLGVRVVRGAIVQNEVTIEADVHAAQGAIADPGPVTPEDLAALEAEPAVVPEVQTTPEAVPEVPAAPIEGEKTVPVPASPEAEAPKE
jgi:hypothetical protein